MTQTSTHAAESEISVRRMLIVGPPGAGKGTQAARLAQTLGIPAISTGDIFRANVAEETELGVLAKSYMDAGEYVPDEVTNDMVKDRLAQDDARDGFLLDGYPRTREQVKALDAILKTDGKSLEAVVQLVVDVDEVVQRLVRRGTDEGRSDDTEETIRHRMKVYERETAPVVATYETRGLVRHVNGMQSVDAVTEAILQDLATL
ncbi:MAG: adenylate kinase [Brachybacterium sp.]|nr:adenylate kinase [Brachybacterium sp.]